MRAASGALVLGFLGACGSGGGGSGASSLNIGSCSLGCTVSGSNQASCGVTDVFLNQEIRIVFTSPIDVTTVDNNSFQVADVASGKVPAATFTVDPVDERILIYRPLLTFDSSGNPIFGLSEDRSYAFRVPGQAAPSSVGPFIKSTNGKSNQTLLACTLKASRGIFDAKPGPPLVSLSVDVVASLDANGNPDLIDFNQAATGATSVWRGSDIQITFDDVMNPSTLVNPVTGTSNTLRVKIDPDGNLADTTDQVDLPGVFSIFLDQDAQVTTVTFIPDGGFPSSGSDLLNPRRIVVTVPDSIEDLGGNAIVNSGNVSFTVETIKFDPVALTEDFETNTAEDSLHTGSTWNENGLLLAQRPAGAGILGGGSGRLGDLLVPPGTVLTLNTDLETFSDPIFNDLSIYDPRSIIDPLVFGQPQTVVDGVFEFASLLIDSGAILRFEGSKPARLLVRGEISLIGELDLSGINGADHDSAVFNGGLGGVPGAGGGLGGDGGDRPDGGAFLAIGGADNPNDPAVYADVNGKDGGGIAIPNTLAPTGTAGAGKGGLAWPQPTAANPNLHFPTDILDVVGLEFESFQRCQMVGPGGVGEAGAYALIGSAGNYIPSGGGPTSLQNPFTPPPSFGGGDPSNLMLDSMVRTLDPNLGYLRGGAGGGGGGAHLQGTRSNGNRIDPTAAGCTIPPQGQMLMLEAYSAHSSAGGGGAGGGLQIQSGRRILHTGILDLSGGDGGSFLVGSQGLTQAGGGGSGGVVLYQAPEISIQDVPGRFNVRGGVGGEGANVSLGGDGSPGLLRFDRFDTALMVSTEASKIFPSQTDLSGTYGVGTDAILSTGIWSPSGLGPEALSGAQSCWIRPAGNFFVIEFDSDNPTTGELGWDMQLVIDGFANPQSYRGANELFNDTLENVFGNVLGASPLVVRFQGARIVGSLSDPCDLVLNGFGSRVLPGSLTGWVDHPDDLNNFFGDGIAPNIIRFSVIWDSSNPSFTGLQGIEEISFGGQPD